MDFLDLLGNMKSFHLLISALQKNITENKQMGVVTYSLRNQKILSLLQINGYIDGFKILDSKYIYVYYKFKNNKNVIKRVYSFRASNRYRFNASLNFNKFSLTNFTILSTRKGLITNKDLLLNNLSGIPILGIL